MSAGSAEVHRVIGRGGRRRLEIAQSEPALWLIRGVRRRPLARAVSLTRIVPAIGCGTRIRATVLAKGDERLTSLTRPPSVGVAAVLCLLAALSVRPLEVVPFVGAISWLAIAAFGLALIARDGILGLVVKTA